MQLWRTESGSVVGLAGGSVRTSRERPPRPGDNTWFLRDAGTGGALVLEIDAFPIFPAPIVGVEVRAPSGELETLEVEEGAEAASFPISDLTDDEPYSLQWRAVYVGIASPWSSIKTETPTSAPVDPPPPPPPPPAEDGPWPEWGAATTVKIPGADLTLRFWDAAEGGNPKEVYVAWAGVPAWNHVTGEDIWLPCLVSDEEFWFDTDRPSSQVTHNLSQITIQTDKGPVTQTRLRTGAPATLWSDGMMENPTFLTEQGWCEFSHWILGSRNSTYNHSLNIDPGATGNRIHVPVGAKTVYRKTLTEHSLGESDQRYENPLPSVDWTSKNLNYIDITIWDEIPPAGFFKPAAANTTKTIWGTISDVGFSVLRSLPRTSAMQMPTPAEIEAQGYLRIDAMLHGTNSGQWMRSMNVEHNSGSQHYSASFGRRRHIAALMLHSDFPEQDKAKTFYRMVQMGIEVCEAYRGGWPGFAGAGQQSGHQVPAYFAAFALGNADLLAAARAVQGIEFNQTNFWWKEEDVGTPVRFPGTNGNFYQTVFDLHVDTPGWNAGAADPGDDPLDVGDNLNISTLVRTPYRITTYYQRESGAMAVMALQNGPGEISGVEALLDGPNDLTNPRAAIIANLDRQAAWGGPDNLSLPEGDYIQAGRGTLSSALVRRFYNEHRDTIGPARYVMIPDSWDWGDRNPLGRLPNGAQRVVPTEGGFTYNLDINFSSAPITERQLRVSIDGGRSWRLFTDVPAIGEITDLRRGTIHHLSERRGNPEFGPWSPIFPRTSGFPDRARFATLGEEDAAAPNNTIAPVVSIRPYPLWPGPVWEPCPETIPADGDTEIHAGVGYWTGGPNLDFTYQWQRNTGSGWDNISGEDVSAYSWTGEAPGTQLRCAVTCDTGTGSPVTVETNSVTVPG